MTANPTVTKLVLNGTNYPELCQSGQCTIKHGTHANFITPTPESQVMTYHVDFKLINKMPQKDLGAKKKEFLEQFDAAMYACRIDDIVEENNQELYICHSDSNTLTRTFDSKSRYYDSTGIYDAKDNTLTVTGNYSHSS